MYTEHEDIEINRCVRMVTGVGCISAWEATSLFYQHYAKGSRGVTHVKNIEELPERIRGR